MVEEQRSFESFVSARGPALLRFAYLLTHDAGRAEDLVQFALIKLHRRWTRLQSEQPEAYVKRIIVNDFASWRRRRSSGELPGPIPDIAMPDAAAGIADRDQMWRALQTLPRRQSAVLVLRYYEDVTDEHIASLLGTTIGNVRSLASRAFATLRESRHLLVEPSTAEETS